MLWRPSIMVLLVIFSLEISAQVGSPGEKIIQYLETLAEYASSSETISGISDEIDNLLENPVKINSGSEQEISRLFFLTYYQVRSLTGYVKKGNGLISASEIGYIPGFDVELAKLIEPFIIIDYPDSRRKTNKPITRALVNYISKKSYSDPKAPGLPFKQLSKLSFISGSFQSGLTIEKDQGEKFFTGTKEPDFLSGHISFSNNGIINNITLGDIRVRFGQGLVTWTGYQAGVTPLNPGPMRGQAAITPYTSTDENNFFRGAGVTAGNEKHTLLAYISGNNIDATVADVNGQASITSFYDAGLHNSSSTLLKRNSVTEYSGGLSYNLNRDKFHTGFSLSATSFSLPVSADSTTVNYFDFSGKENIAGSVDYSLALKKLYIYGETAWNPGGGFAHLAGVKAIPSPGTTINVLYTSVGKGYNSFHGIASGKETVDRFRESVLLHFSFEPFKHLYLITGILYTRDLWYGLYGALPKASKRFDTEIRYSPSEIFTLNTTLRFRIFETDESGVRGMKYTSVAGYSNLRFNFLLNPTDRLTFNSRIELISSQGKGLSGYLLFSGFRFRPASSYFTLLGRVYVWSTNDYDTRIYAWEDDLLYTSSINPYYYSGSRSYLVLSYGKSSKFSGRIKVGFIQMNYPSGEIRADNEIKLQLRVRIY